MKIKISYTPHFRNCAELLYQPAVMLKVYFPIRKKIISTRLKFRP